MPLTEIYPIRQKTLKSFDQTKIGYQVIGKGKKTIILCNGLGGSAIAWKPLYDYLGKRYRFIMWDYRGLFHSDPPANESNMTIQDHTADLDCIIKKENISKAILGGWSMGVQVCLEYYRRNPKVYQGMILLNGTYGYPFDTALKNPLSRFILPKVNELAHKIVPAVQPTLKPLAEKIIDWKGLVNLISRLGLVHKNLNSEVFQQVAREMLQTDLKMYHEIMRHLSEHDASDLLPKVKVPTLVIAGDEDIITPVKVAEKMAKDIPEAELFIVPHGTHYSILEFSDLINMRVDRFLSEHNS